MILQKWGAVVDRLVVVFRITYTYYRIPLIVRCTRYNIM